MRQSVPRNELALWERRVVATCREQVQRETESRLTEGCTRCQRLAARTMIVVVIGITANALLAVCCGLFGWR